MYFVELSKH